MRKLRDSQLAVAAMVLIAVLWGSSAVVMKGLLTRIPAPDMLASRFIIATLVLALVCPRALRMSRRTLVSGLVMGALFGTAQITQTIGLAHTPASVSGFLTGLSVVVTPLLSWIVFGRRLSRAVWTSVGLATMGLAAFTLLPAAGGSTGSVWGEVLTLISAVLFAAHMLVTGQRVTAETAMSLTIVQTAVSALLSLVVAAPGGLVLPHGGRDWLAMGWIAVVCGALCLFLQIWAQSHVDPVRAAVIMCSEPLWVALFAVLFVGESLTLPVWVGGLLIVGAMLAVVAPGGTVLPLLGRLRRSSFARAA